MDERPEQRDSLPCQIGSVPNLILSGGGGINPLADVWRWGRRFLKRRGNYLLNCWSREAPPGGEEGAPLLPGTRVRVKSEAEIRATLNRWNQLKGCAFMNEMLPFCDSRQTVLKPVARFLDERDYRMKKCRGIYLLEGVYCSGTVDFGSCDRTCFYFWRREWLEQAE
ncbi:hypothetical protein [Geomesophilobacter sediminis]|uniref:Uncharacterized protein n=1 Tax=Geomesophilobacter sediminis TaxID=2798584 RepID=A0A8J7J3K8_9BACT|nr:hypothetical protein [Geomesophilobacter sediminis]MBJ6725353.1 hypothetical protein [Geomesophilobacter sediminis]